MKFCIILTLLMCMQCISAMPVCEIYRQLSKAILDGKLAATIQKWLCIMYEDTRYDETTVKDSSSGPRYGLFQIQSDTYCVYGRKGGNCNKDCRDFLDTDLTDDIACANLVYSTDRPGTDRDGFNYWEIWRDVCSKKSLANFGENCRQSTTSARTTSVHG